MTLTHYSASGKKQANLEVSETIFGLTKINHNLIKQAYEYYLNKKRLNLAKTKTRSMVRGGGRKPYRQKGTGQARAGTIRSPIWRGGGITFGPTGLENYERKMNKKAKIVALRHALSLNRDQIIIIESLPTDGKTATLASLLFKTLELNRRVLLIDIDIERSLQQSANNLEDVSLIDVQYVNVFRILNSDWIIMTEDCLEILEKKLGSLVTIKG